MGKISQGVLGGFSGKVGNVIGGTWKGIDYMRIKPANVANPRTPGQVDQRTKFTTALKFLQPMTDFIKVGYKIYANKQTAFNSAMSYQLLNAITGSSPDFEISYADALVSKGNLTGSLNASASSTRSGTVDLTWDDNSGSGAALASDKALIVIYNPITSEAVTTTAGALRSSGGQSMSVPFPYTGDTVQVYLGFISDNGRSVSNSDYLGSIEVA